MLRQFEERTEYEIESRLVAAEARDREAAPETRVLADPPLAFAVRAVAGAAVDVASTTNAAVAGREGFAGAGALNVFLKRDGLALRGGVDVAGTANASVETTRGAGDLDWARSVGCKRRGPDVASTTAAGVGEARGGGGGNRLRVDVGRHF